MAEVTLSVGVSKIRQFEKKKPIAAVAELIWNALDANATQVTVQLMRTESDAVERIVVTDNGHGITPTVAAETFSKYGDTWKASKTHTPGNERVLHGRNGEGRLFTFSLGDTMTWTTVATVNGANLRTTVRGTRADPCSWSIEEPEPTTDPTGTVVSITVPQGERHASLEGSNAAVNVTAKLAFYLRAYPNVVVAYEQEVLNADDIIASVEDLPIADLPPEYASYAVPPVLTFVEWNRKIIDRRLLICDPNGIALTEHGPDWSDTIVSFTPYLRWHWEGPLASDELHALTMKHSHLLLAAERTIRDRVTARQREISRHVVQQLKSEGNYPYDEQRTDPPYVAERQTFDLVVTVARDALPPKGKPRRLSVRLLHAALERDPSDLQKILEQVLGLDEEERQRLARLLDATPLSNVIGAASVVVDRLNMIALLRRIFADRELRLSFREIDQLHPIVARNLWLFGEEWTLSRTEVGLTNVLASHLGLLGSDVALETRLNTVTREDGRQGRVDVLLFRGIGDDDASERLIVELKRPSVLLGRTELEQIKSYARAIVDDPQFKSTPCRWRFVLLGYDTHDEIQRDIRQRGKPSGLADDQDEYEVWVRTWGEVLDSSERKLRFFERQLQYEATDASVVSFLLDSYKELIPVALLPETQAMPRPRRRETQTRAPSASPPLGSGSATRSHDSADRP